MATVSNIEITALVRPVDADPILARNGDPWFTPQYGHFLGVIESGVLWFDVLASVEESGPRPGDAYTNLYRSLSAKSASDLPRWIVDAAREVATAVGARLPFEDEEARDE